MHSLIELQLKTLPTRLHFVAIIKRLGQIDQYIVDKNCYTQITKTTVSWSI